MMINKRLVETVGDAKKYIGRNVALQWCALAANIVIVFAVGNLLEKLLLGSAGAALPGATAAVLLAAAAWSVFRGLRADFFWSKSWGTFFFSYPFVSGVCLGCLAQTAEAAKAQ